MLTSSTTQAPSETDADTEALGLFAGEDLPADAPPELAELIAAGEARSSFKALALAHIDQKRRLLVGLGSRADFTPERARVAAATACARAQEISTRTLCWRVPAGCGPEIAAALVEGTILAAYRFERHKSKSSEDDPDAPPKIERLIVAAAGGDESLSVASAGQGADGEAPGTA
ncbi:MAG TPA: M17 family peptidase N-terminal domain-containing protein, partial [Solirubrobacteraceae bacterium]|nr:M17 family peptidase N-terminal domain-containing protein [Solirubrobacteraceae bacterium]